MRGFPIDDRIGRVGVTTVRVAMHIDTRTGRAIGICKSKLMTLDCRQPRGRSLLIPILPNAAKSDTDKALRHSHRGSQRGPYQVWSD
jgi:hypothetical protein